MDDEKFIIHLGADTTEFDAKFEEANKKISQMADHIVIDFDASNADSELNNATAAMEKFKNTSKSTSRETTEIGEGIGRIKSSARDLIKNSKTLDSAFTKIKKTSSKMLNFDIGGKSLKEVAKSVGDVFSNDAGVKYDKQRKIGIRPLRAFPWGTNKDFGLLEKTVVPAARFMGLPKVANRLSERVNPPKEDLSPSEALGRFKGMTKAMTYSPVIENMFGSLADNRARAAILNKIYIDAKEGLAKYDQQIKIAKANIQALEAAEKELKDTQLNLWKSNPNAEEFTNYDDYKASLLGQKASLEAVNSDEKLQLGQLGVDAIDDKIKEVSSELEELNKERRNGLADKSLKRDSEEYTILVAKIQQYRRELFELQSLRANEGMAYEPAEVGPNDLRTKIKGIGENVVYDENAENDLQKVNALLDKMEKEYTGISDKIKIIRDNMGAFKNVLVDSETGLRILILDLQKNPDEEGYESDELEKYNRQWKIMRAQFDKDNPTKKLVNGFTRLGARIKQQMISIVANWLNPIYVVQRGINAFMENNVKYANTFKVVAFNMYRVIEPLIKNLITWVLKGLQYINIFVKSWAGIDLFDKSAYTLNKMKTQIQDITASFDELHNIGKTDTTLMDTGELPMIDLNLKKKFEKLAEDLKPAMQTLGNILSEAFKHPLKSLIGVWLMAEVTKLLKTLFGSTLLNIGKAGFKALFNAVKGFFSLPTLFGTAGAADKAAWSFLTPLQKVGVVLKTILGTALTIGSAILNWTASFDLTKNGKELSGLEKAFGRVKQAAGLAGVAIGTFIATGNPLIAACATAATYLVQLGVEFFTTKTAIGSLNDELEEYQNALDEANTAEEAYREGLEELRGLEEAYGQTGKEVWESVQSGKVAYEDLTYAQMQLYNMYDKVSKLQNDSVQASFKANEEKLDIEIRKVKDNQQNWEDCYNKIEQAYKNGEISFSQYVDSCEELYAELDGEAQKTFVRKIPASIRESWNPQHYTSGWQRVREYFARNPIKATFDVILTPLATTLLGGVIGFAATGGNPLGAVIGGGIGLAGGAAWSKSQTNKAVGAGDVNEYTVGEDYDPKKDYPKYAIGTNYVPNDQLAFVHKGEAIVPAEYNKAANQGGAYKPVETSNAKLELILNKLTYATNELTNVINQGINVSGEFKQRGTDLYATVEKVRTLKGSATILNNPSFAR